ncbi:MAG: 6-pyruvoyl trahydropterin synthase family protein [Candidatus Heimdallarchaeaceae archaeon]
MYSITKEFTFEAAHKLNLDYESECSSLHGHSYRVQIEIHARKLNRNGMIIDFKELNCIKEYVNENWDHATIISKNDPEIERFKKEISMKISIFPYKNVTAELMAKHLWLISTNMINKKIKCKIIVRIWETAKNSATFYTI